MRISWSEVKDEGRERRSEVKDEERWSEVKDEGRERWSEVKDEGRGGVR